MRVILSSPFYHNEQGDSFSGIFGCSQEGSMIQASKLGHLVLKVRNAGASRDFYTRTLGLKVAHEDLEQGMVFLSFGQEHHELALFQLATGEAPSATQPGLHHMAWKLRSFGVDATMPRGDLARSPPTPAPVDETVDLLHVEATHLRRSPLAPNHSSGVLLPVKDVGQRVLHRPRIARGRARDAPLPVPRTQ